MKRVLIVTALMGASAAAWAEAPGGPNCGWGNMLMDVARGDGEALTAVAVSMGVSESDRPLFKAVMHENFATLFPSENVTAEQVTNRIIEVMRANDQLAKYVS